MYNNVIIEVILTVILHELQLDSKIKHSKIFK